MFKKLTGFALISAICAINTFAVTNYPFPQQAKYPNGFLPAGIDHKHVQTVYEVWLKNYYVESGDQARIKFDTPEFTVSEGIGYGMLVMVYMDNEKNNTQAKFDKLWKYYNSHLNNGVMDWKISGFGGTAGDGSGGATDAELDVAVALIMANKQWGDAKYLTDAKALINKIYSLEVKNNVLVGGSQWAALNPSYMSTVATELFQAVTGESKWSTVQTNCYSLLSKSQNTTTGMWPNWCNESGQPGGGVGDGALQVCYGFDASRTPWRLGWAYAWYGHSQAKTLLDKIVSWFKTHTDDTPGKIGQVYNLNGTIASSSIGGNEANIPTFLGPLTIGGIVDPKFQTWVDKGYTRLRSFNSTNDNYYNECLELLSMLLLTGNMPDFTKVQPKSSATLTVKVTPAGAGTVTVSPQKSSYSINESVSISTTNSDASRYQFVGWDGDLTGTTTSATVKVYCDMTITAVYKDTKAQDLVDDCEDNNYKTNLGSEWFTYTDVADKGKSTITPKTDETTKTYFTMTAGGYNNSKYAAKIEFKLDKGEFAYDPFVGVGFEMEPEGKPVNIKSATGISFYYKGSFGTAKCALKFETKSVTESGADFALSLPSSTTWKEVNVTWDKFLQPSWVKEPVEPDFTQITKFQWQIQGTTGVSGELWIDDIHLIGYPITPTRAIPKTLNHTNTLSALSFTQAGSNVKVKFATKHSGIVKLALYDLNGKLVRDLLQENKDAGVHTTQFNTSDLLLSNRSYVVTMSTVDGSFSKQMILNR